MNSWTVDYAKMDTTRNSDYVDSEASSSTIDFNEPHDSPTPPSSSKRRKQPNPKRSPSLDDPDFRGVLVHMVGKFVGKEWKLFISRTFVPSKEDLKKKRRPRRKLSFSDSETEDEDAVAVNVNAALIEKHCASCSAKKTPLWRDAEDGTPLCNACGIRYKKYKMRCGHCWHIPKKDETSPYCKSCGSDFQYARFGHW